MSAHDDDERAIANRGDEEGRRGYRDADADDEEIREIHALATPPPSSRRTRREASWGTATSSEGASTENFTTISREFNALVIAGTALGGDGGEGGDGSGLARIREEETNPLAIVPERNPLDDPDPNRGAGGGTASRERSSDDGGGRGEVSVHRVKMEEAEAKITAWQTAKIAKVNNRFKREDAVINGWESDRVQRATSRMKKVERKLEEKKAKAMEKMQNEVAKAHRKAEEKRASAEAKRGTKVARILELANLMRTVGRPPVKRCF